MAGANEKKVWVGLSGFRGLAIILVMISHCSWKLNEYGKNILDYAGAWGVSCFLMLGGFLFVNRYKDAKIGMGEVVRLVKHRIKKCYPLHLFTLVAALPLSMHFMISMPGKALVSFLCNLSLTQAAFPSSTVYFSFNAVSWYLSLDILMVLCLPAILWMVSKLDQRKYIMSLGSVLVLQILLAVILSDSRFAHWFLYIFPPVRALDYYAGGGISCLIYGTAKDKKSGIALSVLSLFGSVALLLLSMHSNHNIFLSAVWTVPVSGLLYGILKLEHEGHFFKNKILVWIGNISFEIFLVHQLIIRYCSKIIEKMLGRNANWPEYVGMIFLSILAAWILHKIAENRTKKSL